MSVVEPQPVLRLRALLDGFDVPDRDVAFASADIVVTFPGAPTVVTPADLELLRDGVLLVSAGHMVNLAGPRPLGNSIESMDLG